MRPACDQRNVKNRKTGDDRLDYRDDPAAVRAHFPQLGIIISEAVPEIKFGLGPTSYPRDGSPF